MGRGGRGSWDEPEGGLAVPALQIEPMLAALHGHGADFVIIGGFCLFAHGVVRATKDVDIVPAPDPANLGRLAAALSSIEAVPPWPTTSTPANWASASARRGWRSAGTGCCARGTGGST